MLPPSIARASASAGVFTTRAAGNVWQVGTLLDALALTATSAGRVRLQIGARVVEASTDVRLDPGQNLKLRVTETGSRVVLRTEHAGDQAVRVRDAIRSALPRQGLQGQLLATAQSAAQAKLPLPPVISRAVRHFVARIPRAATLTQAATLQRALSMSGTFLEQSIVSGVGSDLAGDWKNILLQLRERLVRYQQADKPVAGGAQARVATQTGTATLPQASPQTGLTEAAALAAADKSGRVAAASVEKVAATAKPAPGPSHPVSSADQAPPLRQRLPVAQPVLSEAKLPAQVETLVGKLLAQTDAALARVKLNQLASVSAEQPGQRLSWLLELPVRHDNGEVEVLPLTIERERGADGAEERPVWTVNLAFDLGGGDSLRARVALRGEQVYTSFWTARETLRAQVEHRLDTLRHALEKNRVRVGCLTCALGRPAAPDEGGEALLETRA